MKKGNLLIFTLILVFFYSNSNSQTIKGNGIKKKETRDLSGFDEIIAQGRFNLILTQGDKEGVTLETDANILEFFQTRIDEKTLYVTMIADIKKSEKLNVYISIKELNKIIILNEISLKTESVIHFDELSIFSGGMSQIIIELYAASLNLQLTDGTYADLKGYSKNLNIRIHDETELNAFDLQSDHCKVISTGLTDAMIWVEKDLQLLVTGSSNLYYMGNPKITNRIFSSTGFVVKRQKKK